MVEVHGVLTEAVSVPFSIALRTNPFDPFASPIFDKAS
jgi:hypothetical protein